MVRGDLRCLSDVLSAIKNHDAELIYHTGALLSARAERYPVSAFRTNLVGTFNVLEAVRLFGVGMVIFASSIATFGEGVSDPVSNEATQKPMTMYGVTKVASERLGEAKKLTVTKVKPHPRQFAGQDDPSPFITLLIKSKSTERGSRRKGFACSRHGLRSGLVLLLRSLRFCAA